MAFQLVQTFDADDVQYGYDRTGDVLYLSFGPPRPAIAVQVEDWLAIRLANRPPLLAGLTIVGFTRILERINRFIDGKPPERRDRSARLTLNISYDVESDTLAVRTEDAGPGVPVFERLGPNVYLEKRLPSKDVVGIEITEYTTCGLRAVQTIVEQIVDTLFGTSPPRDENAHLLTDAALRVIDWVRVAAIAA